MGSCCSRPNNDSRPSLHTDAHSIPPCLDYHQMGVFWDMENCNVDQRYFLRAVNNIRKSLLSFENTQIKISVSCRDENVFGELKNQILHDTGIDMYYAGTEKEAADKDTMLRMFLFALQFSPPAYIMLITGDADFTHTLEALRKRGYTVILVMPEELPRNVSDSLKDSSDFVCSWSSLLQGDGFVDASGKSSSSSRKLSVEICRTTAPESSHARCDTRIFWDVKDCPLAKGMDYGNAVTNIFSFINNHCQINDGMNPPFYAYGTGFMYFPVDQRRSCEALGVEFKHSQTRAKRDARDKMILLDLLVFAHQNPGCNIALITKDEGLYTALSSLEERGCKVILIVPSKTRDLGLKWHDENSLFELSDLV